ncbi:unnamed protein product, partial [Ceratitis capitata]
VHNKIATLNPETNNPNPQIVTREGTISTLAPQFIDYKCQYPRYEAASIRHFTRTLFVRVLTAIASASARCRLKHNFWPSQLWIEGGWNATIADVSALLGISAAVHRIGVQFLRVVSWKTASNRANGAAQLG